MGLTGGHGLNGAGRGVADRNLAAAALSASPAPVPGDSREALAAAVEVMRARGLRLSAARRLVLEALLVADGPMSAEQIAQGIGGRVACSISQPYIATCRPSRKSDSFGMSIWGTAPGCTRSP